MKNHNHENLKHKAVVLEQAIRDLFEFVQSKKFNKRKIKQIEKLFLPVVLELNQEIFEDYDEYLFYFQAAEKTIREGYEEYLQTYRA